MKTSFNSKRYDYKRLPRHPLKSNDLVSIPKGTITSKSGLVTVNGTIVFQFQKVRLQAYQSTYCSSGATGFNSKRYDYKSRSNLAFTASFCFNSKRYDYKKHTLCDSVIIERVSIPKGTITSRKHLISDKIQVMFQFQKVRLQGYCRTRC